MPDDSKKSEKYEKEIRDILNRMDDFIPEDGLRSVPRRPPPQQPRSRKGWSFDFRKWLYSYNSTSLLAGLVIFALAAGLLTRLNMGFLAGLAALIASVCLVGVIFLPMLSRGYGRPEKRWRGQVIDLNEPTRLRQPFSWRHVWWRIKRFFGFR